MTTEPLPIRSLDELKQLYDEAKSIARAEKQMRWRVFSHKPVERDEKVDEMDRLLVILASMKEALKQRMVAEDYQQAPLLDMADVPVAGRRPEYS